MRATDMLRTCPRCGDFYADASLLFCLADGTPLVDVDPHGESWTEGARVVEEKERALRRRTRRLRLRRALLITTTMLIMTTVIVAVAINIYVYVAPNPEAPAVAAMVPPTRTPVRRTETPAWTPTPDTTSGLPFVPAVTPTPTPPPTPPPPPPPPRTPTPQQCTASDKQRLDSDIAAASSGDWERAIDTESERARIGRENLPDGAIKTSVTLSKPLNHAVTFSNACAPVSVNVSYTWVVKWGDSNRMQGGEKRVGGAKTFSCKRDGAAWRCV